MTNLEMMCIGRLVDALKLANDNGVNASFYIGTLSNGDTVANSMINGKALSTCKSLDDDTASTFEAAVKEAIKKPALKWKQDNSVTISGAEYFGGDLCTAT